MAQKKKRLTIAELKTFNGYENTTEEEAENVIDSLEKISLLFISLYHKKKAEMEQELKSEAHTINSKTKLDDEQRNAA